MKRLLPAVLLCSLLLSACAGSSAAPTPAGASGQGVHLIVAVEGALSIKRQGWSDYAPALFGMALRSGDLLRLEGASQATVACSDLTLAKAAGGVSSVPCKATKPVLVYGDSLIVPTRADSPSGIPLVIAPRKTDVLNAHPTLRWLAVPGASTYRVTVRGSKVNWSTEVSGRTELVYPDDAPPLLPGSAYKLIVEAGGRSSDEEQAAGLGFAIARPEVAQAVREREAQIRKLGLAEAPSRLLMANLYASHNLLAEALDLLSAMAAQAPEPAILRSQGDLYLRVGLNRQAEESFRQALQLSQKAGDIEGQAAAHNALGLVYEALGNRQQAAAHGQQAIQWYQKLGDSKSIQQIQQRLAALQK